MKTALIGCGHIAHVHARFLKKIGRSFDIVCDLSTARAQEFAQQYDNPIVVNDVAEMLAEHKPDVVHILVPPQFHYALAKQCLEGGCHVFVEKPICETTAQFDELMAIAAQQQKLISVDHTRVYNPMLIKTRELLAGGRYGDIVSMVYEYDDPSVQRTDSERNPIRYIKGSPPWFNSLRGGVTTDLLPHPLSVLLSLCPDLNLRDVWGKASNGTISELTAALNDDKASAIIRISLHTKPLKNRLTIYCERGTIQIDLRNLYSVFLPDRGLPNIVARVVDTFSSTLQTQFKFVINMVLLIIGKTHMYDGLDGILEQFYKQVDSNKLEALPHINAGPVVKMAEQIITTLVPDNQTQQALNKALNEEFKSRLEQPATTLVTGGTGFIGGQLVKDLAADGQQPRILCRSIASAADLPDNSAIHLGDLRSKPALTEAMQGIDTVYHCAAAMSGDWTEFYSSTVEATNNLLAAAHDAKVKRLIYVSSLGILDYHRLQNGDTIDENSPIEAEADRRGFYSKAKKEAELLVSAFADTHPDCQVIIIRPGLVYGRESNNNLGNAGVALGRLVLMYGMGKRYLGLNYVANLSKALLAFGAADFQSSDDNASQNNCRIINVVDPDQPTVKEYIRTHNQFADENVLAIPVPIFVWKIAFKTVDLLLTAIRKKNPDFSYRFNSNSKTLIFQNRVFGEQYIVEKYYNFFEAMKETLK